MKKKDDYTSKAYKKAYQKWIDSGAPMSGFAHPDDVGWQCIPILDVSKSLGDAPPKQPKRRITVSKKSSTQQPALNMQSEAAVSAVQGQQATTKKENTMKQPTKSTEQPTTSEAAVIVANDKQAAPITAALKPLPVRLKEAWDADTLPFSVSEGSALVLGRVLLEVLEASPHGGMTAFIIASIGEGDTVMYRCEYCLKVAKEAVGWTEKVKVAHKVEDLRNKAAEAKAKAEKLKKGIGGENAFDKTVMKEAADAVKEAEQLTKQIVKVEDNAAKREIKQEAKAALNKKKAPLDEKVESITKRLKELVKEAASGQPRLDFTGVGDAIKGDIDALVNKATELATELASKPTTTFDATFAPTTTEQAQATA